MKNDGVPMVVEGVPFLLIALIAAIGFAVGQLWSLSLLFAFVAAYVAFFFRNPERLPPIGSRLVAAPADGKVIFVGPANEAEFAGGQMLRISIFMSLFDVHVNRVPVDGTVKDMRYHRGRFMAAWEETAGEENERNATLFETAQGVKLVLVQVAGLVARRIVCYPTIGAFCLRGQRLGLIRFGSRCDLFLPTSATAMVKVGEKVLGGETVLAQLVEEGK
ncbi:MAG: phosphatidylserine decarboxylase family protein [Deltaproteobacteria bacterium]|nr:phosphatidylserine decarboxylase family protein [Deltaproteobacteria bacterium]MBI3296355.1 phosphatidylserine decarboxylase family protein [Deltaproteobacteria bacterium]